MPTLKEMIAAENAKRANKKTGLLSALQNAGQVIDQGLLGGRIGQIPQRATEMYQGLLNAPAELAALASPDMAQRFNRAMKNPAPIDRDKAMSMAMDFLQTSTPAGGVAGMFIGKGAKTWDAIKAQQAEELLGKGVDPREVWKQTGTMRGVDKALRQEIPDNLADIEKSHPMAWLSEMSPLGKDIPLEQAQSMGKQYNDMVDQVNMFRSADGTMDSMLLHRDLYNAYPDLRTTRLSFDNMGSAYGGSFDEAANKVSLARGNLGNATEGKSTTLHELQHAIQQREGWAMGGSPDQMRQILGNGEMTGLYSPGELNDAYRRLAGEAEARLTQARMNITMPERLASYPPDMFDIPPDRQIVRGLLR